MSKIKCGGLPVAVRGSGETRADFNFASGALREIYKVVIVLEQAEYFTTNPTHLNHLKELSKLCT